MLSFQVLSIKTHVLVLESLVKADKTDVYHSVQFDGSYVICNGETLAVRAASHGIRSFFAVDYMNDRMGC